MNKNKLFSVVITTVNNDKKYLKNCLLSLEKSAFHAKIKLEIIIICNGTSISYPVYLKSTFKIIKNKFNIGFGQAINKGMKTAKGEWCIILAPDTISQKSTIINLIPFISNPKVVIIAPKIFYLNNQLDFNLNPIPTLWTIFLEQSYLYKSSIPFFSLPNSDKKQYKNNHEIDAVASTYWLVNKKFFWKVGGFDPRFFLFFDDTDLCKRFKDHGYKLLFITEATINHIGHQSSAGTARGDLFFDGLVKYLNKYYPKIYKLTTCLIVIFGCLFRYLYWQIRLRFTNDRRLKVIGEKKSVFYLKIITTFIFVRIT